MRQNNTDYIMATVGCPAAGKLPRVYTEYEKILAGMSQVDFTRTRRV